MFAVAAVALGALLIAGLGGLPAFGHYAGVYGREVAHLAVTERKATDVVNTVTFDYRGLDTMGEEFILFASSTGLVVLLREQRDERRQADERGDQGVGNDDREPGGEPAEELVTGRGPRGTTPVLSAVGRFLVGPILVLGVYLASHGQLTPGGGFQGGVVLAAAVVLVYVAGGRLAMARIRPTAAMEVSEALGAGGYAAIGVAGLIAGGRFLTNFLPLGTPGSFLSGGTIASLSAIVGLEVGGALTLIVSEFVDQGLLVGVRR